MAKKKKKKKKVSKKASKKVTKKTARTGKIRAVINVPIAIHQKLKRVAVMNNLKMNKVLELALANLPIWKKHKDVEL